MVGYRLLLVVCLMILSGVTTAQNYFIANNNPAAEAGANVFTGSTAFQDAISAATDNDIIYVVPSNAAYDATGPINIDKPLKIYGIGLDPSKDGGKLSSLSSLDIRSNDVLLSGLDIQALLTIGFQSSNVTFSNITIENSRVTRILQGNNAVTLNNFLVKNCIFNSSSIPIQLFTTANAVISNNIINTFTVNSIYANTVRFDNNLFFYSGNGFAFGEVDNCFFNYNIFYGTSPNLPGNSQGNTFDYNVSFASTDNVFNLDPAQNNTGTGNLIGDPLFTNVTPSVSWQESFDITLTSGSAAIDIDGNGNDAGPTGGATPWNPEGTVLPIIQSLRVPGTIVQGSDLNVQVEGKGN